MLVGINSSNSGISYTGQQRYDDPSNISSSSQTHEGRKGQNDEFGVVSSEEYEENYSHLLY